MRYRQRPYSYSYKLFPQHYIPDMVKALKGVSARLLMKEFGEELKRNYGEDIYGIRVIL